VTAAGPLLAAISEDVAWYTDRTGRAAAVATFLRHRTARPVLTLRLHQHLAGRPGTAPLRLAVRALHRWACAAAAVDLSVHTRVGPGLKLTHGWGAVISPHAVLGRGVVVMHGATVGGVADRHFPTIGDGVFLGPGCAVLGGVVVGDGAVIGAGCVVTGDVAAGARLDAPAPVPRPAPREREG
jgi:serine O-acetyltransferase